MFRGVLMSVTNVEQVLSSEFCVLSSEFCVLCLAAHRKSKRKSSQCCERGEI